MQPVRRTVLMSIESPNSSYILNRFFELSKLSTSWNKDLEDSYETEVYLDQNGLFRVDVMKYESIEDIENEDKDSKDNRE